MVSGVLDLIVDIIVLVSDVRNLSGDGDVLVFGGRGLGVDVGDLVADVLVLDADRKLVLLIERWRGA